MQSNMAFGADFETETGNSESDRINCHCPLIRRSSSKDCYIALGELILLKGIGDDVGAQLYSPFFAHISVPLNFFLSLC